LLDDVLSLESSYTSPFGDESREDSSDAELRLSGSTSVSGDGASSPFEGLDRPFILLDEWEVNKHCSSLSERRLLKIRSEF